MERDYNLICDRCKRNAATHFTKISFNGYMYEELLCDRCFYEKNESPRDFVQSLAAEESCPDCGTTESDIENSAYVGCAECYSHFRAELLPRIQSYHGTTRHIGKRPSAPKGSQQSTERDNLYRMYNIALAEGRNEDAKKIMEYIKGGRRGDR